MKLYKEEAIILKSTPMREADRVLTLYSVRRGKFRVAAHGVDKPSSRKRGAAQPFTYSRFLLRRGKELDSVDQCEGIEFFPGLLESLEGLAYGSYLAELADAFSPEEEANAGVFNLILDTFRFIGNGYDPVLVRAFEIKLLSLAGYRPHLDSCVSCGSPIDAGRVVLFPSLGGLACPACAEGQGGGYGLNRGCAKTMEVLGRWPAIRLGQLKIGDREAGEMKNALKHFISYHLEGRLKSVKFIDWLEK